MKKYLALLLVLTMTACTFAGCAKKEDTTAKEGTTASETKTGKDTLVMATNATFPPYEFNKDGKIVGIDAEIAQAIADKLGLKLQIEDIEFDSIIAGVTTGKYDMGMAGMTVTEERLKSVNFSTSYAKGVQVVIVPETSPIKSVDDLKATGAKYVAGVQQDTTGHIYATQDLGDKRVVAFNKGADAVAALTSGKVDCVIIDNEPAKSFVAANKGLKILDSKYADENYAICIAKNNKELLDKVNTALGDLIKDGTVQKIVDKYIPAK
ncbi:MAG: ABC transporter substrate-binding protein [Bacillota bacterium]|nr:ABC transporter substrate-binding protein [Bacillota bacterium]